MRFFIKRFARQVTKAFLFYMLSLMVFYSILIGVDSSGPDRAVPLAVLLVIGGLFLNILYHAAGRILAQLLFFGDNSQFFALTPLTPPRLLWENVKWNLGAVLLVPLLGTIGVISLVLVESDSAGSSSEYLILAINFGLTMTALVLNAMVSMVAVRPWVWDVFFCARRLVRDLWLWLGVWPERRWGKRGWSIPLGILLLFIAVVFLNSHEIVVIMPRAIWWLLQTGVPGRIALFLFSPMSGVVYLGDSALGVDAARWLAIGLMGFNLFCLASLERVFRRRIELFEDWQLNQWLAEREETEAVAEVMDQAYEVQMRPMRDRVEALARADGLMELSYDDEVTEIDSEPPVAEHPVSSSTTSFPHSSDSLDSGSETTPPLVVDDSSMLQDQAQIIMDANEFAKQIPYDPTLPLLELIARERKTWKDLLALRGVSLGKPGNNWIGIFSAICILSIPIINSGKGGRSVLAALAIFFVPLSWHILRRLRLISLTAAWAHLIPLRWSDIEARFRLGKCKSDIALNIAMGILLGWVAGGAIPHYLEAILMYFLQIPFAAALVRSTTMYNAGRVWGLPPLVLIVLCETIPCVFLAVNGFSIRPAVAASALAAMDALLILGISIAGLFALNHRRVFDDQVIS